MPHGTSFKTNQLSRQGEIVKDTLGNQIRIEKHLASGGQGEVYVGRHLGTKEKVAVKFWFAKGITVEAKDRVSLMAQLENPDRRRLVWPKGMIEGNRGFWMKLAVPDFVTIDSRTTDPAVAKRLRMSVLYRACAEFPEVFSSLHSNGWIFQDVNSKNLLFNVLTGDVFVLDVDNLVRMQERIFVTAYETTAPELMLGKAPVSVNTDLFGLAVNLFLLLFVNHPLYGRRVGLVSAETRMEHEAKNPLFIFDPKDKSNRPGESERAAEILWPGAPGIVRELFTRAFTVGLREPEARVRKSEWSKLFSTVLNWIARCDKCKSEVLIDFSSKTPKLPTERCRCLSTGVMKRLHVGGSKKDVVVYPSKGLVSSDLGGITSTVLGAVKRHPRKKDVVGLTNKSKEVWSATLPDGRTTTCKPRETIELRPGLSLGLSGTSITVQPITS